MERDSQEREPALDHDKADYLIRRGTTRFMGQGSVKSVGCASNIPLIGRGNPVFEPARMQRSKCNFDCPLIRCNDPFLLRSVTNIGQKGIVPHPPPL